MHIKVCVKVKFFQSDIEKCVFSKSYILRTVKITQNH